MCIFLKNTFIALFFMLLVACGASKVEQEVTVPKQEAVVKIPNSLLQMDTDLVLVYTKTNGYRHKSIEKGVETIKALGLQNKFVVSHTEDSLAFNSNNLKKYDLVIFLSTTQDVLGTEQEEAFERYIKGGGNFLGVHAAADTEYEWPWYNKLVGAYFLSHPKQQEAKIDVVDRTHAATQHLGDTWMHFDEWYNYKDINPDLNVIMKLDESSYEGGENNGNHPIAWYHEFDGGRAFYTGLGHTHEAYDDPDFKKHLLGGILYCLGR
ncbi:ThuA domain-containing protein [Maribacter algicola]|uniref:ThuA domain-containing protein n=1 Tax=Meishania litoralis TaxID=3434685 RepID=A0ACC7LI97_9FLAO